MLNTHSLFHMKNFSYLLVLFLGVNLSNAQTNQEFPKFSEVYELLRSNSGNLTDEEINRAAVLGLLEKLPSQVLLVTNLNETLPGSNLLTRASVLENAFGYLRVGKIETGLDKEFASSYQKLRTTNKLKGIIIDLRYATGTDYSAAARTADNFIEVEKALLQLGEETLRSTRKTNALEIPVAILVNHQTSGAAEALAGMLREAQIGLILGTNTAGQASVFKDFTLINGQRLKIATLPVKLGNGKEMPAGGLKPDIEIVLSGEEEKQFYENSYRVLPRSSALAANLSESTSADTNRPRRRLNEAELVRLQREGLDSDREFSPRDSSTERAVDASAPQLSDPALVRALDLLKGLAVMQQSRRF